MYEALLSYLKALFGLLPKEREYFYFNPEGDFQDIKPLMAIEDNTLVPFLVMAIIFLVCIGWGMYVGIRALQKKRALSHKNSAKQCLRAFVDTKDAKMCAYAFTRWGHYLITPHNQTLYENLERELFDYKYKKETPLLKESESRALKIFLDETHG